MNLIESTIWLKQLTENAISSTVDPTKINRRTTKIKPEPKEKDWEREIISQLPASDLVNYISNPQVGNARSFAKWTQKKQNRKANVLKKDADKPDVLQETINLVKDAQIGPSKKKRRNKKKK